jgi:2-phosphoglycolate phosphatase
MPSPRYKAVLFDLDGTLLDSAHDLLYALNLTLAEESAAPIEYQTLRQYVTHGASRMVSEAFGITKNHPKHAALVKRFLQHYSEQLGNHAMLFPGTSELLDALDSYSIPWGIVTNKHQRFTLPLLAKLNLAERPGCIVCGDTLENHKPHPLPLLYACQGLEKKPTETLYVGDYHSDITASKAAHMPHVLVTYGYYEDHHNLNDWGAQFMADSPSDILKLLT